MDNHSAHVGQGDDANLRLVRFFSICLGSLVFVYALFSVRLFVDAGQFGFTDDLLIALRVVLGAVLCVVAVVLAVQGRPVWLDVLIYVTVFVTVLSGADYFFGLRRGLLERERSGGTGAQGT